jgi:HlyD family secretion protein
MRHDLYRPAALKHMALSERFDTAVSVVGAGSWLVVVAAVALVAITLVWAICGRVPIRVYGEGLLVREGSIVDVTSMAEGQVRRMVVTVGDAVREGEPIAYVEQPELETQRTLLEGKLDEIEKSYHELVALDRKAEARKSRVFAIQQTAVNASLRAMRTQLAFYEQKLLADTELQAQGLVVPALVAETRQRVVDIRDEIFAKQAQGGTIAFDSIEAQRTLVQRKGELALGVSQARRELEELEKRIDMQSVVVAKIAGRVLEMKVTEGDAVTRGRAIATIEVTPAGEELVAELYVPARDGKRVQPGMALKLAPSVLRPEEDGYLEATVKSVSPFPVTEQSMLRAIRNDSLVKSLLKDGPVYEVRGLVTRDRSTASGLRWSNGSGPPMQVVGGTPTRGLISVRARRPIEYVIPAWKRLVFGNEVAQPTDGDR